MRYSSALPRFFLLCLLLGYGPIASMAQPQMQQWSLPPSLVDFNPLGANLLPGSSQLPIQSVSNAMYDQNNQLLFFIIDNEVYDASGCILDNFQINGNQLQLDKIGQEMSIVQVPESCTQYYIIGSYLNAVGNAWIPFYTRLDMAVPNSGNPSLMGDLQVFAPNTNIFDLSSLAPALAFDDPSGPQTERNRFGLAVTPYRVASSDHFLLMKGFGTAFLYRYIIHANGISFDASHPTDGGVITLSPNPAIQDGDNELYPEMEVILASGTYRVANIFDGSRIAISRLNLSDGTFIPGSVQTATLPIVSNVKDNLRGLEFSPNGDFIYYTYHKTNSSGAVLSEHMGYVNLTQSSLVTVDLPNSTYPGANVLGFSFVEMAYDGKLYFNDGGNLLALSNPNAGPAASNWSTAITYGGSLRLLPDQIDGEFYQDNIPPCGQCECPMEPFLFTLTQNGADYPLACLPHGVQTPVLACPPGNVTIAGFIGCLDPITGEPSCEETPVNWTLTDHLGTFIDQGITNNFSSITFPTAQVNQPGTYLLSLQTICGGGQDTCMCTLDWIREECDTCQCGIFTDLFLRGPQGAASQQLICGGPPISVGCPDAGIGYTLTGNFKCAGLDCPPETLLDWSLASPDGAITASGITQVTNNWFAMSLSPTYFTQSGVYQLVLTGMCGDEVCTCVIELLVDTGCPNLCPCDATELQNRVNRGFATIVSNSSCRTCFTPVALDNCETVSWLMVEGPNMVTLGTSVGQETFCVDLSGAGSYAIVMHVTRSGTDGSSCAVFTATQNVELSCTEGQDCEDSVIANASFGEGAIAGSLGDEGASTGWLSIWGDPHINHSHRNSYDDWTVQLTGNADTADVLSRIEPICLVKSTSILQLRLATDPIPGAEQLPVGRGKPRLHIQLQQEGDFVFGECQNMSCYPLASIDLSGIDTGWLDLQIPYDLSEWLILNPCGGVLVRPVVYVTNAFGEGQGGEENLFRVQLDYFCLNGMLVGTAQQDVIRNIRLFPNPTSGALQLHILTNIPPKSQLQVFDLRGRIMYQESLATQATTYDLSVASLPSGIYLVRIVAPDQPVWIQKIVRN